MSKGNRSTREDLRSTREDLRSMCEDLRRKCEGFEMCQLRNLINSITTLSVHGFKLYLHIYRSKMGRPLTSPPLQGAPTRCDRQFEEKSAFPKLI
jgi:hypothetical protein